jgi:hypothetical protein
MHDATCIECGIAFQTNRNRKTCSDECARERRLKYARKYAADRYVPAGTPDLVKCVGCASEFTPRRRNMSKYCSDLCRGVESNRIRRTRLYGEGLRDCIRCGAVSVVPRRPGLAVCESCKADRRDPERARAKEARRRLRKYGLTEETYDELWASQDRRCLCGTDEPGPKGWCIDHCHQGGQVRAILCSNCNCALGFVKDNPATLRILADLLDANSQQLAKTSLV